ncbi:MAG: DNA replication and repair protein RecF [Bacilli bacterium]|jgi:DNA replication and repair protein RecF
MRIEALRLRNFRNYETLTFACGELRHVLEGANGQGKTNLVEALAFCSIGGSFRGAEDKALLRHGESMGWLEVDVVMRETRHTIRVVLTKSGHRFFLDGKESRRQRDILGLVHVVTFAPSDVFWFQGPPKTRRDLVDLELSKQSPSYADALQRYNQLLKQRNELLKQASFDALVLEALDQGCARYGVELIRRRQQFVERLEPAFCHRYASLSGQPLPFILRYESMFDGHEITVETYLQTLVSMHEEDRARGVTQAGPHRDDVVMMVQQTPFAAMGSQGEQRLGVVALALCLADLAEQQTGEPPILVLDDLFSELDDERQGRVLRELHATNQVFLTSADATIFSQDTTHSFQHHHVQAGTIETRRSS